MDAYNYQTVDDEGTPLYTMNTPEVPIEIAPAGMSIQVSREYFKVESLLKQKMVWNWKNSLYWMI